jgi:hypothetical protein
MTADYAYTSIVEKGSYVHGWYSTGTRTGTGTGVLHYYYFDYFISQAVA